MIAIVNYDLGNLGSIANMLKRIGTDAIIFSNHNDIENAKKIIRPGVESFDNSLQKLHKLNLTSVLYKKAMRDKIPMLGVCFGMQLFSKESEEGLFPGLGWIDSEVKRFNLKSFEGDNNLDKAKPLDKLNGSF